MILRNDSAQARVTARERKWNFFYRGAPILSASARYPEVAVPASPRAQRAINGRIRSQVAAFYRYAAGPLYRQAAADWRFAQANDTPFHPYEAILNYETALNCGGYLSLFRDRYEYTGGAHGSTVRSSDTWALQSGRKLPLAAFFRRGEDWRGRVLAQILKQADEAMRQNPGIYFDDYRERIETYFDPANFYLTPSGIAVYFQQYEIAPYSSGIVVFTVSGDTEPSCGGR